MTTGEPWAILLSPISLSLSFALFFSLLIQSFLSFHLSFSFYLVSLSLSLLFPCIPARARVWILSSLGISYLLSFFLSLSPSLSSCSCSTSLVTSRLPTLLESIPLFLSLLSSYLSFFLSFFGRFSQLSLFSSLTPYTCEIRRDNSAVCLLSSQHKPHLSTCLRFMAFLPPLGFLSSSRIQAQFLSFSSTVFPRTYFPLLEGTV